MPPLRWLADENFNNDVTRALVRRRPDLDIVRAQEAGLGGKSDPEVLAWAAAESRVVLTHDVSTVTLHAFSRIKAGEPMPGVWELSRHVSVAQAVQDILLLTDCSLPGEWEGQVRYLPLR
jgi:predicted nuclease of predicted toxin-antitoxin system